MVKVFSLEENFWKHKRMKRNRKLTQKKYASLFNSLTEKLIRKTLLWTKMYEERDL